MVWVKNLTAGPFSFKSSWEASRIFCSPVEGRNIINLQVCDCVFPWVLPPGTQMTIAMYGRKPSTTWGVFSSICTDKASPPRLLSHLYINCHGSSIQVSSFIFPYDFYPYVFLRVLRYAFHFTFQTSHLCLIGGHHLFEDGYLIFFNSKIILQFWSML